MIALLIGATAETSRFDHSGLLVLGVVGGLVVLFLGYLVVDGMYHWFKWRRLRRKFKEAGEDYRSEQ